MGAYNYHLTEKSGWDVESIMVNDLPFHRRNTTSVTLWIQKKGRICVAWVWNREGTEKLVNGKQHSVWFAPTGMKGLPQNVLLNFRLEFPKRGLTINLPSGISEIFCQIWQSYRLLKKKTDDACACAQSGHCPFKTRFKLRGLCFRGLCFLDTRGRLLTCCWLN